MRYCCNNKATRHSAYCAFNAFRCIFWLLAKRQGTNRLGLNMEITLDELSQLLKLMEIKQSQKPTIAAQTPTKHRRNKSLSRHHWTKEEYKTVADMTNSGYTPSQIAHQLQLRTGQVEGAQMVLRKLERVSS